MIFRRRQLPSSETSSSTHRIRLASTREARACETTAAACISLDLQKENAFSDDRVCLLCVTLY